MERQNFGEPINSYYSWTRGIASISGIRTKMWICVVGTVNSFMRFRDEKLENEYEIERVFIIFVT